MLTTRRLPSHLMFLGGINGTSAAPIVVPDASTGTARERLVMGGPSEGQKKGTTTEDAAMYMGRGIWGQGIPRKRA